MRKGLNKRNLDYWQNTIFIGYQKKDEDISKLLAYSVCSEQEIDMLKERVKKLENKLNILTK